MHHFSGFAPLADRYDGFILDLWGVIHDGVQALPGAVDCLTRLRDAGKRTLLLSNVPRPNSAVQAQMRPMGIADDLYTAILTSGQAVHEALRDRPDLWWAELGRNVFHLGPARDRSVLEGLDFVRVDDPAAAHFVLNTGPDDHANPTDMAAFEGVLAACRGHGLPMICANPDLVVIRGGQRVLCAGSLAARYQALGGDVRSLGKPDPAIYQPALERLGLPPARVLAVGDALYTDMAGAASVALDACWVLGGIHAEELGGPDRYDLPGAEALAAADGLAPLASVPRFTW